MSRESPAEPVSSDTRLHDAGLRSTLPRRAVLDTVMATNEHRSADEIRRVLEEHRVDLPRSSVNNILGTLARAGIINRVDTLPGPTRFERDTSDHHHFWCATCRRVTNVPARRLQRPEVSGRVLATAVIYLGECETCGGEDESDKPRREGNP